LTAGSAGRRAVLAKVPGGSTDLGRLGEFISQFTLEQLPGELLPVARACLLYGLAVGVATLHVPEARAICAAIDADGGSGAGPAIRLLDGRQASTGDAALANGVLLSGRVQGDSHPAGHLGGVVIPAALAVAQSRGLTGAGMLAAMVGGYETALRIGRDHSAALSGRGFRTTPAYGVFGAAAASALGMGLDPSATTSALALAANLASGLREYVNAGTTESPFQAGFAARSGVSAALLAGTGTRAAGSALHGSAGFFTAYGGSGSDHGSRLLAGLGRQFEFPSVTYKPYPACQFLRGAIDGLATLRGQAGRAAPTRLEIRLNPFEADFVGVRYAGPFTSSSQTVMSAPFCAALTWVAGTVSYAGLRDFADPAVLALVPLVRVTGDQALARYQTQLRVELGDGRTLILDDDRDAGAYRLTWDAAVVSATLLCDEAGAAPALADDLIKAVRRIDEAPDTSAVTGAVRRLIADATEYVASRG
jgi:2-methylcitrate dehydratase PrpD